MKYPTIVILCIVTFCASAFAETDASNPPKTFTLAGDKTMFMFYAAQNFMTTPSQLDGAIALLPAALDENFKAVINIDMTRLRTEALVVTKAQRVFWGGDTYPRAILRIERLSQVEKPQLDDGKQMSAKGVASLELHGVKKPVVLDNLRLTYVSKDNPLVEWLPGDTLRVDGEFLIRLADYGIRSEPELTAEIKVVFSLLAVDTSEGMRLPSEKIGEYLRVPFGFLSHYWLDEPDWGQMRNPQYLDSLSYDAKIPDEVKRLDGKKVAVTGFMLPVDLDKGNVKSFMLLRSQNSCCFGVAPRINEVIHAEVMGKQKVESVMDIPTTVFGTLLVGERLHKDLFMVGVYSLLVDEVRRGSLSAPKD